MSRPVIRTAREISIVLFFALAGATARAQTFAPIDSPQLPSHAWGIAWGDYDRDGRADFVGRWFEPDRSRLFRNLGGFAFEEVTDRVGISAQGRAHAWADYDGDGWLDLYVVVQGGPNRLYRNERCGGFADVAIAAGVAGTADESDFNAAWADHDGDGRADLYVTGMSGGRLFRNLGDGTFADVTLLAGIPGYDRAFSLAWGDANDDGLPDLFLTHIFGRSNALYENLGSGAFRERAGEAGVADAALPYGPAWADYDGDGRLDLFVAMKLAGKSALFRNRGDGGFHDRSDAAGVRIPGRKTWGSASWGDFDLDGWIDLVAGDSGTHPGPIQVFRNRGNGSFEYISDREGFTSGAVSGPSVLLGDADGDGAPDLYAGQGGLYANRGPRGAWLAVRLVGNRSTKDALGARVVVRAGGRAIVREISSGTGYATQDGAPGWAHFGLGAATRADSIEVRWPGGSRTVRADLALNRVLTLIEGPDGNTRTGRAVRVDLSSSVAIVFDAVTVEGSTVLSAAAADGGPPPPVGYDPVEFEAVEGTLSSRFRITTTAETRGDAVLLVRMDSPLENLALVHWDESGVGSSESPLPTCVEPGWRAYRAPGPGLFALSLAPVSVTVRVEPETLEWFGSGERSGQAVVTAFVTLPSSTAVADIDPTSWRLAGAPVVRSTRAGEGRIVLHFLRRDLELPGASGSTLLVLEGRTLSGRGLVGSDRVRVQ